MATLNRKLKKPISRLLLRPPSRPSGGLQRLRDVLVGVARLSRADPVPLQYRVLVNWGNTAPIRSERPNLTILNKPEAIAKAVNKLTAFKILKENNVRVPEYQTDPPNVGKDGIWLARTVLGGSGGEGIVAIRQGDPVPSAPLYVKYVPKLVEFRLHVTGGKVIFAQQKRRKSSVEQDKDQKLIRNHANGWVFCPVSIDEVSEDAKNVAVNGVAALGLDFGAVDLIIGKSDSLAYLLEINTAPGLESEGLINAYATEFAAHARLAA